MYVFGTIGKVELTVIMDYSSCNRSGCLVHVKSESVLRIHTCRYHRKPGELCGYVSRQFTLLSFLRWSSDYTHSLVVGVSPTLSVSYFQGYYVGGHLQLVYHNASVSSGRILDWTCVLCEVASFPLCTWRLLSLLVYSLGLG